MSGAAEAGDGLVEVPWTALDADILDALIEEFVTRDGTDYGTDEVPLARKVEQVRAQLRRGEVVIVVDTLAESVTLLAQRDWRARQQVPGS
jgi:uncharacterized protein YheU (UPF0270 family)